MTDYGFEDDESYHQRKQAKETRETIRELTRQRDEALGRIARALNVINDPAGEYQRGGSASDAVQDMTCALEGFTQTEDGTWIEAAR